MEFARLSKVAIAITALREVNDVLDGIVTGLVMEGDVALARIWLLAPGDVCPRCPAAEQCTDRRLCLHLVASDGRSVASPGERWRRLDGLYQRFPLNSPVMGGVAVSGDSVLLNDIASTPGRAADPDWARREQLRAFAAHPLVFRGEILGVLGLFHRDEIQDEQMAILRLFANHAAAAIANARAFEEIDQLRREAEVENERLRIEVSGAPGAPVVGQSATFRRILRQVDAIAPTDAPVLVTGETGTGKELIARAIHDRGRRRDAPLIVVNCASVPRDLFESEFFGHVRGAYTGAVRDRAGRFQLADGGTLVLDEVGEIPIDLQAKLLRVLEHGTFERIGEERTRRADVRLIAATNRDLEAEVRAGRFREDLYYRLNVCHVAAPPLRERLDDVPPLARHFLEEICRRLGRPVPSLTDQDLAALQRYAWPGNVRELRSVIERAVILAQQGRLDFQLPVAPLASRDDVGGLAAPPIQTPARTYDDLRRIERETVARALEHSRGKISGPGGAAELLGLKPTTLAYRIRALGLARQ